MSSPSSHFYALSPSISSSALVAILFLGSGFLIMSVATFTRVVSVSLMLISRNIAQSFLFLFWVESIYPALRIIAYLVLIASYVYSAFTGREASDLAVISPPLFLVYNPPFELIS